MLWFVDFLAFSGQCAFEHIYFAGEKPDSSKIFQVSATTPGLLGQPVGTSPPAQQPSPPPVICAITNSSSLNQPQQQEPPTPMDTVVRLSPRAINFGVFLCIYRNHTDETHSCLFLQLVSPGNACHAGADSADRPIREHLQWGLDVRDVVPRLHPTLDPGPQPGSTAHGAQPLQPQPKPQYTEVSECKGIAVLRMW